MKLIDFTCPHCGAQLKIDSGQQKVKCGFCDSEMLIEQQEPRYINHSFERERPQERQQFTYVQPLSVEPVPQPSALPKKRHTVWWVLGWIFIFPLPLTIIVSRSSKLNLIAKIVIIALSWLVYLILALSQK
ncbi:MAG: hypothetical protein IJG87_06020 [Ruminococcus sp.]|nr:hypothetical protein [Ruminococcus sp.]